MQRGFEERDHSPYTPIANQYFCFVSQNLSPKKKFKTQISSRTQKPESILNISVRFARNVEQKSEHIIF